MGQPMTTMEFLRFMTRERDLMDSTLNRKAKEYAPGQEDRLGNFNNAARISKTSPAEALEGMLLKHYTAYRDMIEEVTNWRRLDRNQKPVWSQAQIDERFGDIINYFTLQKAIFMVNHCSDANGQDTQGD